MFNSNRNDAEFRFAVIAADANDGRDAVFEGVLPVMDDETIETFGMMSQ